MFIIKDGILVSTKLSRQWVHKLQAKITKGNHFIAILTELLLQSYIKGEEILKVLMDRQNGLRNKNVEIENKIDNIKLEMDKIRKENKELKTKNRIEKEVKKIARD